MLVRLLCVLLESRMVHIDGHVCFDDDVQEEAKHAQWSVTRESNVSCKMQAALLNLTTLTSSARQDTIHQNVLVLCVVAANWWDLDEVCLHFARHC